VGSGATAEQSLATATRVQELNARKSSEQIGGLSFFWLSGFYLVYCVRPEDWIHPVAVLPLAKITGVAALLAFLFRTKKGTRSFRDLPRESYFLLAMIGVLLVSAVFSPIWRGGALTNTLDFAKVYIVWALTFLLVTDMARLRRIVFIQVASVPAICLLSIIKGHNQARLDGVLGGIYSNPNDLAFAIVLSIPFCLMFLLRTRSVVRKLLWTAALLLMSTALVMTASRGGFITLVVSGAVCLWHFGVKGKRLYLVAASGLVVLLLLAFSGGTMKDRFSSMWEDTPTTREQRRAQGSYEQRWYLIETAIEGIEHYPILGIGAENFTTYSGEWREVHMTFLQIAVEGGIPSLILYLLFFARGFRNLRLLQKHKDLDPDVRLFVGALHSSLVGFVVGALFAPEAYQFFPFFAVAYTAALLAIVREQEAAPLMARPAVIA
jgi:hypothetical protein